jgi:hypothetical protein
MERPDSDWDILVCLSAECYQESGRNATGEYVYYQPLDKIEQQIAFDVELRHEAIDLFFSDPGGGLRRWQWLEVRELLALLSDKELAVLKELIGDVESLLELPEEEALERLEQACTTAREPLYILGHYLTGDLCGDFDRLYRSLSDAKQLYPRTKEAQYMHRRRFAGRITHLAAEVEAGLLSVMIKGRTVEPEEEWTPGSEDWSEEWTVPEGTAGAAVLLAAASHGLVVEVAGEKNPFAETASSVVETAWLLCEVD